MQFNYVRPDLLPYDMGELCNYLLDLGIRSQMMKEEDGVHIGTDLDATDALAAYVPTALQGTYVEPLPAYLRDHVQHLRDYRALVRGGGTPTDAQTAHVIADIIDALRLLNSRITGD